tara:strand:+ start:1674 stop:1886 length:213 start_codon:yes stop_codon:yes gene_type:complete
MKTSQLETLKEVLRIADDLADMMCNGMQVIDFSSGRVRELDLTINCINAGHEIVDRQLELNKEIKKETEQ